MAGGGAWGGGGTRSEDPTGPPTPGSAGRAEPGGEGGGEALGELPAPAPLAPTGAWRGPRGGPGASARARWVGVDRVDTRDLFELVLGRPAPWSRSAPAGIAEAWPPLSALARTDPAELVRDFGLRPKEAERLAAAFALGRRLARFRRPPRAPLRSPDRVARLFADELAGLPQETFHVLVLDGRHALLGRFEISRGTLTTSLVHPREVFRPAIARGAAAVIGLHNHPSGDPEPSADDLAVTRRLIDAGRLLGIPLLDHVVLGAGRHVSLRTRMDFDRRA